MTIFDPKGGDGPKCVFFTRILTAPHYEGEDALHEAWNPGFIPYINDYSKILCFGKSGSDHPICLDYRDNLKDPQIIAHAETHWRRVAPNFTDYKELIEPYDDDEYERRMDELEPP